MRVMVFVRSTENAETKGFVPTPEAKKAMQAMEKFNDELRAAGILKMAAGLKTSAYGKRVAFDGTDRTVINGPFPIQGNWSLDSGCGT